MPIIALIQVSGDPDKAFRYSFIWRLL
jgi:hypothetical protein